MIRLFLYPLLILLLFAACKKDRHQHCPVMPVDRSSSQKADLTPVASFSEIMDTLAKYPQLHPTRLLTGYGAVGFYANLHCNVYFKDLRIVDKIYSLHVPYYPDIAIKQTIPDDIKISLEPQISMEKAIRIAREATDYQFCGTTELCLYDRTYNTKNAIPDYRLIWEITSPEYRRLLAWIDAQTGEVIFSYTGSRDNFYAD